MTPLALGLKLLPLFLRPVSGLASPLSVDGTKREHKTEIQNTDMTVQ